MGRLFYEVTAVFNEQATADAWMAWLRNEHIAEVVACGAISGRAVRLDEPLTIAAQYEFADRAAFDRYIGEHAPRLRADGLQRFPTDRVKYSRRSGEIVS